MAADVLQHDDDGRDRIAGRAPTEIACPYCRAETLLAEGSAWSACERCGRALHGGAQHAFARAQERFREGVGAWQGLVSRSRRPRGVEAQEALRSLQQAHSGLTEALRLGLEESQREAGIEMMAGIMQVFLERGMASPLEARYWTRLVVELTARREWEALRERLAAPPGRGLVALVRRARWRARERQLARALAALGRQIRQLEAMIGFVDPPLAPPRL